MARKITNEIFTAEMKHKNLNITVLGEYTGMAHKILVQCEHNHQWYGTAGDLIRGSGCPHCNHIKLSNDRSSSQEYVEDKIKGSDIKIIGEYTNVRSRIQVQCTKCQYIWEPIANNLLSGYGCPKCFENKGEKLVRKFLESNNIIFEPQKTFDGMVYVSSLAIDFYLPKLNIAIEVDGRQHREPVDLFGGEEGFALTQKRDNIKNEYCKNNGIKMIRLEYQGYNVNKFKKNLPQLLKEILDYPTCQVEEG